MKIKKECGMKTIDGEKIFQHNIYCGFEFYIVLCLTSYVLLLTSCFSLFTHQFFRFKNLRNIHDSHFFLSG